MEIDLINFLVTGGAGFIGRNFTQLLLSKGFKVTVLDKLTYSGSKENLREFSKDKNFEFIKGSILDFEKLNNIVSKTHFDSIINFAAETHVDRSIDNSDDFVITNILGVQKLISLSKKIYQKNKHFKFLQVSTDEVFGSIDKGSFNEKSPYKPNSPYAASKAAADHLVFSNHKTFGFPGIISNCSNNYGPFQFPEKLVPLLIIKALRNEKLPIYGNGKNYRDWLHVFDHCAALLLILEKGTIGKNYLIGSNSCISNIKMANIICNALDNLIPLKNRKYSELIAFVEDRPGHDFRYAVDSKKTIDEIGWKPQYKFKDGIINTIKWYINNPAWWEKILNKNYTGQRLGLISKVNKF